MRLGVLDVGSNTVHLLVVDAHPGARPVHKTSTKSVLRLMKYLQPDGSISKAGVERIMETMHAAAAHIEAANLDELLPMATSALREAKNGPKLLKRIRKECGIDLQVMSGADEARVTFLAVRRWFGWNAGRILLVDIGGGSLELAVGTDELPELALSLPLGAGRMTKQFLTDDPPSDSELETLQAHIDEVLPEAVERLGELRHADQVVGSSKTIRSLARLAGSQAEGLGGNTRTRLYRWQLEDWLPRLAELPSKARSALPGITQDRAFQIVGGGTVLLSVMRALDIERLDISPWAMREGVLLDYLDRLPNDPEKKRK
ncbi:Ppx/GppA family phosphatase [Gulosibacter faecalis]|jgi:exopolyphosphatase/guanosine-5'-triphosphate,3'-diphosphate pyrophosphatase|uniref:Ppx/GppA family phosphatase n=1 Tax=Gulosibacter faecalis TaxID=272240 RepID=A0ABW5V0H0_9MICO|nr:Ppx/GppA phosphatase family protein [Gulosibacter faecalis]